MNEAAPRHHAFLRWLAGDTSLSAAARDLITDGASMIFVSAASAWEIATKHRLGKLPGAAAIAPISRLPSGAKVSSRSR